MTCQQIPKEESYEFFENIEEYIKTAKSAENTVGLSIGESGCNSFMTSFGSLFTVNTTAKIICKQFIKLYNSLTALKCNSNSNTNYKKCRDFLNYWVNFKLIEAMKNKENSVSNVYDHLEAEITGTDFSTNLVCIQDINKEILKKMNILYSLYEKYIDLRTILNDESNVNTAKTLSYSNECVNNYNKAISMCKGKKNKFFEELEKYKKKYETLYELVEKRRSDYYTSFVRLTNDNNNIVTTSVLGTTVGLVPLFGLLYKFTPIGQLFNLKSRTLTKEYSNNGKERKNNPLMDYENEQMNLEQERYNIKYHSV
ncbi:unnamed protein product [Plasmodium vivax]|uniref:(malaria parasite P. vivax) hypothetical protein n=1 Tax=Plasmodium vivax TaxID=5855 RepID=A0A8S4HEB7_PLAVI|nr:unnamed protein product [Plasmodium vivax]